MSGAENWWQNFRFPTGLIERAKLTTSVLSPLVWPLALLSMATVFCAFLKTEAIWLFGPLAALYSVFFLAAYVYFAIRDPDRLQSETHQWRVNKLLFDERAKQMRTIDVTPVANTEPNTMLGQTGVSSGK